jgi:hypothetical protein
VNYLVEDVRHLHFKTAYVFVVAYKVLKMVLVQGVMHTHGQEAALHQFG